jgi:hypothetical protein
VALVVIIPYHPVSSVSAMFSMSKLYRWSIRYQFRRNNIYWFAIMYIYVL